jgi:hypothetical protein
MVKLIALLAALVLALPAQAQTYKTKAAIQTEITTNWPDNTTGLITPALLRSTVNDITASYNQAPQVNAQTGTSYALLTTDYGQLVTLSNTAAVAVTLSQATTAGFSPWNVTLCNLNTGVVTVTPTTSTIGGQTTLVLGINNCARVVSDGTNYQVMYVVQQAGLLAYTLKGINFNSANTDNLFNLVLPPGYSNYLVNAVYLSGASHTLVTATASVWTAAAAGGTAIVANASAITVSGTASGAATSAQSFTVVGANTVMWALASVPILYFRVQNAEGAAATGTVTILITPVS